MAISVLLLVMDNADVNDIVPQTSGLPENDIPEWMDSLIDNIRFPKKQELSRLANFMLIDIRLIFIIVSVYITIGTAITTAANNEAANDTNGNGTFDLTSRSEHQNVVVSQVTNSVLWNCREKSLTKEYYRALYGLLFSTFTLIMLVFIVTRSSVLFANLQQGADRLKKALWRIQLLKYLRKRIKQHIKENEDKVDADEQERKFFKSFSEELDLERKHESIQGGTGITRLTAKVPKVHGSILIIPFFEALFLVLALPFMLTTYDLNPMGCLAGPDEDAIEYNNVTGKVHLQFKQSVLNYQMAALIISILLMIPLAVFALLLPVQYGRITKKMGQNLKAKQKQCETEN